MSVIVLLVIIGVVVAGGFLLAFVWSVKSGQYDDTYSPAVRILFDDTIPVDERIVNPKGTVHKKKSHKKGDDEIEKREKQN